MGERGRRSSGQVVSEFRSPPCRIASVSDTYRNGKNRSIGLNLEKYAKTLVFRGFLQFSATPGQEVFRYSQSAGCRFKSYMAHSPQSVYEQLTGPTPFDTSAFAQQARRSPPTRH